MTHKQLFNQIIQKKSFLCIGLDPDMERIPQHVKDNYDDPVFEFNRQIIRATEDLCVAYKPNFAFYEALGSKGWESLEKTVNFITRNHFKIADAKRGDIGNTAKMYAKSVFEKMNFDAITLSPYMGSDSVLPFLEYKDKTAILLALTSNKSNSDYQLKKLVTDDLVYEEVIQESTKWTKAKNLMYVVGATHPEYFESVRRWAPDHFLLVPGVGAQGGSISEVCKHGLNKQVGLIINATRSIIYAGIGEDFAAKARIKASEYVYEMEHILRDQGFV